MVKTFTHDTVYENERFEGFSCQNISLHGTQFYQCVFDQGDFQYSELKSCSFEDCTFSNCNCSLLKIPNSRLTNVLFNTCKLLGINWSSGNKLFTPAFSGCNLDSCVFSDLNLTKFRFDDCSLNDATFFRVSLADAVFHNCSLKNCSFSQADLTNTDFSTSYDYFINAENNKLRKTLFSLPEATSLLKNFDIILK